MSNNQNEAKLLKVSIAEFIGPLLKRLALAQEILPRDTEMAKIIEKIGREVVKTKDSHDSIQNWDIMLIGYFGKIERHIDSLIDHYDDTMTEMNEGIVRSELLEILDNFSKASIPEFIGPLLKCRFIGPLLKRLALAQEILPRDSEMAKIIEKIGREVVKTKDSHDSIPNWDIMLIGYFGKIERHIDSLIDHYDDTMTEMNEGIVRSELLDILDNFSKKPSDKASVLRQKTKIVENPELSNCSSQEIEPSMDIRDLDTLDVHSSLCLYSLGIFPENTVLKKRFVIYWWTGLGLLPWDRWKATELHGRNIFSDLVNKGFLKPVDIREHNQVIDSCTIDPTIHKWLISANENNEIGESEHFISPFFGDWFNTKILLNLDKRYLNSKEISTKHNLQVVQLGNWRSTEKNFVNFGKETNGKRTMSTDHIEVDDIAFFKKMGQKITYVSLRGILRLKEVHESLGKLENLLILDLGACYNLSKLPQKPTSTLKEKIIRWILPHKISWFNKLMVLDITDCYLVDHMPKWVSELSNLEVLKGFVVGGERNNNRFCQLGDLSKLNYLKKLSIRIAPGIWGSEVFQGFNLLVNLLVLTITWAENMSKELPPYSLPKNIEKLDIRCYPDTEASKLQNYEELKNLRRLYIRGGNLTKIPCHDNWKVEILRLRFLIKLVPTDWNEVRSSFKYIKYLEYVGCRKPKNFPNKDGSSWRDEE